MPAFRPQKQTNRPRAALVAASLALGGVALLLVLWALLRPVGRTPFLNITQGWSETPVQAGDLTGLQLQRYLEGGDDEAMLLVASNHQWVQARLDGEVLYETAPTHPRQNPGLDVHMIPLPPDYAGRELTLTLTTPYPVYTRHVDRVLLGSALALEEALLKMDWFPLILALFSTAIGVAVTVVSCVLAVRRRLPGTMAGGVALGTYALFWGLYTAADTLTFLLLVPPVAASGGVLVLYTLWPFFLVGYLHSRFARGRRLLVPALVLEGAACLACMAYALFGLWEIEPMLLVINGAHTATIALALAAGVVEYRSGNAFLRFLLPWLLAAAGASLTAFLRFYVAQDYALDWLFQLAFFALLAAMCGYTLLQTYRQWLADRDEARVLKLKDWAIAGSYEAVQQKDEELRKLRHELAHQLAGVQALLAQGDTAKARAFLGDYLQKSQQDDAFTQNTFVDVILRDIHSRALLLGAEAAIEASLPPALPVPENDFCGILMNLADNALDACAQMPEGERRAVRLRLHIRQPYLLIYCENTRPAGPLKLRDGRYQSTKAGLSHGYGLRVVEDLVERNDGLLDIDSTSGRFVVSAALRLRQRDG